jgi:hypothetical protein
MHIVTTSIQRNSNKISFHNPRKNQSEKTRKEIEIEYGLEKAESSKQTNILNLYPINAQELLMAKRKPKGRFQMY